MASRPGISRRWRERKRHSPQYRATLLIQDARRRASRVNMDFAITVEDITARLEHGHCEVTGLPFIYGAGAACPWSPSLDRIDCTKGYTPDNVRLVVWIYNAAKNAFADADVVKMAVALLTVGILND